MPMHYPELAPYTATGSPDRYGDSAAANSAPLSDTPGVPNTASNIAVTDDPLILGTYAGLWLLRSFPIR